MCLGTRWWCIVVTLTTEVKKSFGSLYELLILMPQSWCVAGCSFSPCVCACLYYSLIWSELSTTAMPALMAQLKQYGVRKRCKRSLLQMLFPSNDSMMICCTGLGSVWPLMHFLLGVAMIPTAAWFVVPGVIVIALTCHARSQAGKGLMASQQLHPCLQSERMACRLRIIDLSELPKYLQLERPGVVCLW